MYSPLDQFYIIDLFSFKPTTHLNKLYSYFTENDSPSAFSNVGLETNYIIINNVTIFLFISFSLFFINLRSQATKNILIKGYNNQILFNSMLSFVKKIIDQNIISQVKFLQIYTPYIFFIFFLVLSSNLIGMVPYSFTVTSSLIVTFSIALATYIGLNLLGIYFHRWNFFNIFLPPGCPTYIAPFIVIIEFISYLARVFSLSIRLFANMMAGHTLLKILAGFSWLIILSNQFFYISVPVIGVGLLAITTLEVAVAFLQAYVFIVLTCIYIKDAITLH